MLEKSFQQSEALLSVVSSFVCCVWCLFCFLLKVKRVLCLRQLLVLFKIHQWWYFNGAPWPLGQGAIPLAKWFASIPWNLEDWGLKPTRAIFTLPYV